MTEEDKIEIHKHIIQNEIINEIELFNNGSLKRKVELAKVLGVSKAFVSQLYSCDKFFNLEHLAKIQMELKLKMTVKFQDVDMLRKEYPMNAFSLTMTSSVQNTNIPTNRTVNNSDKYNIPVAKSS